MPVVRDTFEKWATEPPREWNIKRFPKKSDWPGQYMIYAVQCAWEAWLEATVIQNAKTIRILDDAKKRV